MSITSPVLVANGVALHDYGEGASDPSCDKGTLLHFVPPSTVGWTSVTYRVLTRPPGGTADFVPSGFNADLTPDADGVWELELTAVGGGERKATRGYVIVCNITTNRSIRLIPSGIALRDRDAFYRDRHNELATQVDQIAGGSLSGDATKLQGRDILNTAPTPKQLLGWNGAAWAPYSPTQDDILPGFAIASFTKVGGSAMVEVGTSIVTPSFAASYTGHNPTSAVLTDNQGTPAKDVSTTPLSFASNGSFSLSSIGNVVWSLTADGKVANVTQSFGVAIYFGVSTQAAGYDAAFVATLSKSLTQSRVRGSTSFAASTDKYAFVWVADELFGATDPAFIFNGATPLILDNVGAITMPAAGAVTKPGKLWRTNIGLGTFTLSWS